MDRLDELALKFSEVLVETERFAPDELAEYQNRLLTPLISHARLQTTIYKERLAPLFRGEEIDLTNWRDVPVLTREQAQRQASDLAARTLPEHAGHVTSEETSGSTGRPFKHLRNELVEISNIALTDRTFRWWGLDGTKTMASFTSRRRDLAPPPAGSTLGGWRTGIRGHHHVIDMWADTDKQIDWLMARRPDYLIAYSSTLLALAERVRARGLVLRFLRIFSVATAITDEIRNICEEVFGTRPVDQYGAQEVGLMACECPWCGHYHVNAEAVVIEILRNDGSPAAPGEIGRVVATSLYNYAMPFIRYEVGDYAVAGPKRTKCKIRLPSLARVLGRYRGTFTLKDGRIIYPYVEIGRFRDFFLFEQVQVVQTDYDTIEVRYVPLNNEPADDAGLQDYIRRTIDESLRVRTVAVSEIPRTSSGKFEDFISLVPRQRG